MALIRWVLFVLSAECVGLLIITPRGTATAILAALFFLFFTLYCWALGAFARTPHTDSRKAKP